MRARSVGSNDACTRPASMREKSSSVLTSFSSRSALRCDGLAGPHPAGSRSATRARPRVGPSISVSGVRNSWLTLEKNAVFARSSSASASARASASSSARALATAVPICDATMSGNHGTRRRT